MGGVGKILGGTICLETGDLKRFSSVGDYTSYCRCVPSKKTSNQKKKGEGNRKNGNKYLALAWMEAAQGALTHQPEARRYYQRKKARKNVWVARKSLAHKLCRAGYFMLRDQTEYSSARLFG
jgi:transposase